MRPMLAASRPWSRGHSLRRALPCPLVGLEHPPPADNGTCSPARLLQDRGPHDADPASRAAVLMRAAVATPPVLCVPAGRATPCLAVAVPRQSSESSGRVVRVAAVWLAPPRHHGRWAARIVSPAGTKLSAVPARCAR